MATAYAAFTSLMHLVADLHDHPNPPIQLDEAQVESLNSKINFFHRLLEDDHNTIDHGLEIRIADAARDVEDLIETHMAEGCHDLMDFSGSLQILIEGLDSVANKVLETNQDEQRQPRGHPMPLASLESPSATFGESFVVGVEDAIEKIVDKLTPQNKSSRQIISISGMGGIGKTTLARMLYDNKYIKNYFDIRAWSTVSKNYNTRASLVEILHSLCSTESEESLSKKNEYDLGEQLYKHLIGRRYLVILDDVWDVEAWDRLRSYFPANSVSGIVITTRELEVASISSRRFDVDLLDERNSWDLFCHKVFGKNSCPLELVSVGKNIIKNCRGLPLSIVVIGGHLAKSPKTREYWEYIEKNLSSIVNSEDDNHCLEILRLSYTNLPVHLKPCFLYMGAIFREDENIRVSQLIKLWVSEGFVKPVNGKTLEEVARDYLNDLIGRNLILTSTSSRRERVKRCKIHDLLRDLCLKLAFENNFLCTVQRLDGLGVPNNQRRMVVHPIASEANNYMYQTVVIQSPTFIRTLIFYGILPSVIYKSLRVLSLAGGSLTSSQHTILEAPHQLVNLRCLYLFPDYSNIYFLIPRSTFSLWNLQSLVIANVKEVMTLPEIWKMPQLRHINIPYLYLPIPHPTESKDDDMVLKHLQSARKLTNFSFYEDLAKRVPNIKKLEVTYTDELEGFDESARALSNVDRLEKLESFTCSFSPRILKSIEDALRNLTFPSSLKKLVFGRLHWDDVTTKIGSLPQLEVLELYCCLGRAWDLDEVQFGRLKWLVLGHCDDLGCFTADNYQFPCLQYLELSYMDSLKEISSDVGDIETLRLMVLHDCPDSAVVSAKEIAEEQYEKDNEELCIEARLDSESELSAADLSTSNFHVE